MKTAVAAILVPALAASLACNYLIYSRYSGTRAVVRVGDATITRKDYQDRLDHLYGKTVLNKMVYATLIHNAAVKAGVAPTKQDVDGRIAEIERHNPQVLTDAKRDPTLMADLRETLDQDIAFENLRGKDVKASDAELLAYYNANKAEFSVPTQAQTTIVVARNEMDAGVAKEFLEQGMSDSTISRQPRLRVAGVGGFSLPTDLPAALRTQLNQAIFKLKPKQTATIPVGTGFLIIRLNSIDNAGTPAFEKVKPLVSRLYKLAKGTPPDIELVKLYRDGHVSLDVDKYAPFFSDINGAVDRLNKSEAAGGTAAAATGSTSSPVSTGNP